MSTLQIKYCLEPPSMVLFISFDLAVLEQTFALDIIGIIMVAKLTITLSLDSRNIEKNICFDDR